MTTEPERERALRRELLQAQIAICEQTVEISQLHAQVANLSRSRAMQAQANAKRLAADLAALDKPADKAPAAQPKPTRKPKGPRT